MLLHTLFEQCDLGLCGESPDKAKVKLRNVCAIIFILSISLPVNAMTLRISANGIAEPGDTVHCFPGDPVTLGIWSPDGYLGETDNINFILVVDTQYGRITGGSVSVNAPTGTIIRGQDAQTVIGPPQDGIWGSIMSIFGTPSSGGVYIEDILYMGELVGVATINLYTSIDLETFSLVDSIMIHQDIRDRAPVGTAFTYQGRLIDSNIPAGGEYDLRFTLERVSAEYSQIGEDILADDVTVVDGYFTVDLDFGSDVFDGNAVWLEIAVRAGDMNDPNAFTVLSPRQFITPVTYSLVTRGVIVDSNDNVGLGTNSPDNKLHIVGKIRIVDGTEGENKVLTSDPNGVANWQSPLVPEELPSGVIVMWYGSIASIPSGWALCDGSNATPDLRDRFIVSASQDNSGIANTNITGSLSQTGGGTSHSHSGSTSISSSTASVSPEAGSYVSGPMHTHTFISETADTLPRYYALAYIMKL